MVVYPLVCLVTVVALLIVFVLVAEVIDRIGMSRHFVKEKKVNEAGKKLAALTARNSARVRQDDFRRLAREMLAEPQEIRIGDIPGRWSFKESSVWVDCSDCDGSVENAAVYLREKASLQPKRVYVNWNTIPASWYREDLLQTLMKDGRGYELAAQQYLQPFFRLGWDLCRSRDALDISTR